MVKIDPKTLNIVIPVTNDDGEMVYIHSTPITREFFKEHYIALSKTLAAIYGQQIHTFAPAIGVLMLRDMCDDPAKADALVNEIVRLSNVMVSPFNTQTPLDDAVRSGLMSEEDFDEALGLLVFFTCISHVQRKAERKPLLNGLNFLFDAQITSSTVMGYRASLQTSKPVEISSKVQPPPEPEPEPQVMSANKAASLIPS